MNYLDGIFDFLQNFVYTFVSLYLKITRYYLTLNNFHNLIKIVTSTIKHSIDKQKCNRILFSKFNMKV